MSTNKHSNFKKKSAKRSDQICILVVDDELSINENYSQVYKKEGYRVDSAFDGVEAIEQIKNKYYDLIHLDLMMPNADGVEVMDTIRDEHLEYGKIVVVSPLGSDNVIKKALQRGADYYLVSTDFNNEEFIDEISKLLTKRNQSDHQIHDDTKQKYSTIDQVIDDQPTTIFDSPNAEYAQPKLYEADLWEKIKGVGTFIVIALIVLWIFGFFDKDNSKPYKTGDLSDQGGTPTQRYEDTPIYDDDPYTTNDESNDQPTGYYGSETVYACNSNSGNCYDLDADLYDSEIQRLYFPKGGWVDISYSDCSSYSCYAEDENGTEWDIERY